MRHRLGKSHSVTSPERRIGEYRLERRLGRGGMAEVWIARRQRAGCTKYVALKLIAPHHAGAERYVRMFRAEAELSAQLAHANIVQVFDAGQDQGRDYLVMEWVDGPSLGTLMPTLWAEPDGVRRQRIAAFVTGQLLHALGYAHGLTTGRGKSLHIVHRDVSPHNVLVSVSGDVKLTDFGVACRVTEETSGQHVKGKLRYMPREQITGESRAPTVDLYAVGAILHEMLDCRRFRHEASGDGQLYGAVLSGHLPQLSATVAPQLEALRFGLLHPNPRHRIQSADEALRMLQRWPGYRDMRLDLGRLCTRMTGLGRPRSDPGPSETDPGAISETRSTCAAALSPAVAASDEAPVRHQEGHQDRRPGRSIAARVGPGSVPTRVRRVAWSPVGLQSPASTASAPPAPGGAGTPRATSPPGVVAVPSRVERSSAAHRAVVATGMMVAVIALGLGFGWALFHWADDGFETPPAKASTAR